MRIEAVAFTERGADLGETLRRRLDGRNCSDTLQVTRCGGEGQSLAAWMDAVFADSEALLFIGAAGIAARALANRPGGKLNDPAVVVMDEAGRFAIPLLSGHYGGANALAERLAECVGATPVITTATDVNGVFAVDVWAREQGLRIHNPEAIKKVSGKLLRGEQARLFSAFPIKNDPPPEVVLTDDAGDADVIVGVESGLAGNSNVLILIPPALTLGVGCKKNTSATALAEAFARLCAARMLFPEAVGRICSIDIKKDEPGLLDFCRRLGLPLTVYSARELAAAAGEFAHSSFVAATTGVDNVCERSAVLGSGGRLVAGKTADQGVALALAVGSVELSFSAGNDDTGKSRAGVRAGTVYVVGIGPGNEHDMTHRAKAALAAADLLCGYDGYLDLVRPLFPDKVCMGTGMRKEVERCRLALDAAATGKIAAMVCGGDPGVYGMAGLLLELAAERPPVDIEIVPGVSAAMAGAALLGAPLTHDFAVISLSDLLTPWETISARLRAATAADFVICLYNPASRRRVDHLRRACDIVLETRSRDTVCGWARNAGRDGEAFGVTSLAALRESTVDMFTTVFIGSGATRNLNGKMTTPRGYRGVGL